METLKDYLEEQLRDPEFAKAYAEVEAEMTIAKTIIETRISQNLTMEELAERIGIKPYKIMKWERGEAVPSIHMLRQLADGMEVVLNVSFSPKTTEDILE